MNFISSLLQGSQILKFNFSMNRSANNHFSMPSLPQQYQKDHLVTVKQEDTLNQQIVPQKNIVSNQNNPLELMIQQEIIQNQILQSIFQEQQRQQLIQMLRSQNTPLISKQADQLLQNESVGISLQECKKKIKKINLCHPEREHYAKRLCSNCYHKHGRTKKPWKCQHDKLYAVGLCQNCYINQYNQKKKSDPSMKEDQRNLIEQK